MKISANLLVLVAVLVLGAQVQAQTGKAAQYQEGLHYFEIDGAPATIQQPLELVEAFSYLCSHCNTFDPYIDAWKQRKPDNVEFRRIPVVFGRASWELYARGFVTAQMLGVEDAAHAAMMDRLWKDKEIMRSMEDIAEFYGQFGVEADKFMGAARSFAVEARLKKDQQLLQSYGITGTPSLVLGGKYRVAGNAAVPSFDVMLDVVDFLIERESAGWQPDSVAAD
jgi:thiol:disulfide interchange protein DsbA